MIVDKIVNNENFVVTEQHFEHDKKKLKVIPDKPDFSIRFRAYDDDHILYFTGIMKGDPEQYKGIDDTALDILCDILRRGWGVSYIKLYNRKTKKYLDTADC